MFLQFTKMLHFIHQKEVLAFREREAESYIKGRARREKVKQRREARNTWA